MKLLLLHSGADPAPDLMAALTAFHDVLPLAVDKLLSTDPAELLLCVIDADLSSHSTQRLIQTRLAEIGDAVPRIFVLDHFDRRSFMAASACGADEFLGRPLELTRVQAILARQANGSLEAYWRRLSPVQASALKISLKVFEDTNNHAMRAEPLDASAICESASCVVAALDQVGLDAWMRALRDHHRYTFRHVMFVTGSLASAAKLLGFTSSDCQSIVSAGLLHDIGKARVPIEILDKPSRLDESEWSVMRQHPRFGAEIMAAGKWDETAIDVVLHHHERLDGAGYPDGICDAQIRDLTRLVSIADVYSALVDKRAYKVAMSGEAAFEAMSSFRGHLDPFLLKAFQPIATSVR